MKIVHQVLVSLRQDFCVLVAIFYNYFISVIGYVSFHVVDGRFKEVEQKMQSVMDDHKLALDHVSDDLDAVKAFLFNPQRPQISGSPSVSRYFF